MIEMKNLISRFQRKPVPKENDEHGVWQPQDALKHWLILPEDGCKTKIMEERKEGILQQNSRL